MFLISQWCPYLTICPSWQGMLFTQPDYNIQIKRLALVLLFSSPQNLSLSTSDLRRNSPIGEKKKKKTTNRHEYSDRVVWIFHISLVSLGRNGFSLSLIFGDFDTFENKPVVHRTLLLSVSSLTLLFKSMLKSCFPLLKNKTAFNSKKHIITYYCSPRLFSFTASLDPISALHPAPTARHFLRSCFTRLLLMCHAGGRQMVLEWEEYFFCGVCTSQILPEESWRPVFICFCLMFLELPRYTPDHSLHEKLNLAPHASALWS